MKKIRRERQVRNYISLEADHGRCSCMPIIKYRGLGGGGYENQTPPMRGWHNLEHATLKRSLSGHRLNAEIKEQERNEREMEKEGSIANPNRTMVGQSVPD